MAGIVGGITKLGKIKYRGVERYIENLRKMFLAMAEDARVVIVKFADRLHNLQTLDAILSRKTPTHRPQSLEISHRSQPPRHGRSNCAAFTCPREYAWTSIGTTRSVRMMKRMDLRDMLAGGADVRRKSTAG